jgi:asparagine synthase (glutamine-hydrolysing)
MCGIAGQINFSKPVDEKNIVAMTEAIRHRGPDGDGVYVNETKDRRAGSPQVIVFRFNPSGQTTHDQRGQLALDYLQRRNL